MLAGCGGGTTQTYKMFGDNVVNTKQSGFLTVESDAEYYYGDRANEAYPIKKMIDSGISVGIMTDFSVSALTYSPAQVFVGVVATGGGTPLLHDPLTVQDVIQVFSIVSANTTGKHDT